MNRIFLKRVKYLSLSYHSKAGTYGYKPKLNNPSFSIPKSSLNNRIKNSHLYQLVLAFQNHGHKIASLNPLENTLNKSALELDPSYYGVDLTDGGSISSEGIVHIKQEKTTISDILLHLKKSYCGYIGVELQHLNEEEIAWLSEELEKLQNEFVLPSDQKKLLAFELLKSQTFDNFLATKFSTVKRYSGEGAESMIAFFLETFKESSSLKLTDIVIGIPHRGRLNLLTGLLKFPHVAMFHKMKGFPEFLPETGASGDVLSHLTSSVDLQYGDNPVHVTLLPNPSHLEAVSPVAVGYSRSRLQSHLSGDYSKSNEDLNYPVLPIQVHGDASFSGQGVVMETLAMANVAHFSVGGSVHLIVNNQIGFTTPQDIGSSSSYSSDIMKMISAPVIHVNGDFPEEVIKATKLALGYRQKFKKDVLIDLICFRRWGHNELDDPTFTNPAMYKIIHSRKSVPDLYTDTLINEGIISEDDRRDVTSTYHSLLNENLKEVDSYQSKYSSLNKNWKNYNQLKNSISVWDTGVPIDLLKFIGVKSATLPDTMTIHPTLSKNFVHERKRKMEEGLPIDWATAESLAIGSLLYQGHNVRISGQDVGRGTFSHRHAMLIDQTTNEMYVPLNYMKEDQTAFFEVANSPLSEEAVLSFEYGFSVENVDNLVIWEAQFGDFFNSAQVVFDTLISSGEAKWMLPSGIVILLPHGYDGAGPEHSSCRMERFLQMCDSNESNIDSDDVNWQVVYPTTPAQYFHLLRKQVVSDYRKPLMIVGPKILLRHPSAVSLLSDMGPGKSFLPVLQDDGVKAEKVKTVVFCSGKHFYLLQKERESRAKNDFAIVRLEALCPFPAEQLYEQLKKFKNAKNFIWSQEEPQNMGPWTFVKTRFENLLGCKLKFCGRKPLAAPAVGVGKHHQQEIENFLNQTFQ